MDNEKLKDIFKRMKKEYSRAYLKAHYMNTTIIENEKELVKNLNDSFNKSEKVVDGRQSIKPYELITWNNHNK